MKALNHEEADRVPIDIGGIYNFRERMIKMLKGIPDIISPQLMKTIMEMGHGDEIVIADGNFPAESLGNRVIRCDGHGGKEVLESILKFFPLDEYVDSPVILMEPTDKDLKTPIWKDYRVIINNYSEKQPNIDKISRKEFYKRSEKAYAIIASSELQLYANIILKKGVIEK
jgi:L-fucose mutarotase